MDPRQRIELDGEIHAADWLLHTGAGQARLALAHTAGRTPRCLCVSRGVDMYVGRRLGRHYLARLPGTGPLHDAACPSVDDANFFSGASCYAPAILKEGDDGVTSVPLGRKLPRGSQLAAMSLEGLLDLLIEEAGLNSCEPGARRVSWAQAQRAIAAAAGRLAIEQRLLSETLTVPPPFDKERQAENEAFCHARLLLAGRPMLLAPLREARATDRGTLLTVKHLPGWKIFVPARVGAAMEQRHRGGVSLAQPPRYGLCLVRLVDAGRNGMFLADELALRRTDPSLMPSASDQDEAVAAWLASLGRPFMHPLRFDAPLEQPLADFALTDGDAPHPVFVLAATGCKAMDEAKRAAALALVRDGRGGASVWDGQWINPPLAENPVDSARCAKDREVFP